MTKRVIKIKGDEISNSSKVDKLIENISNIKSELSEADLLKITSELESRKKELLNKRLLEENKIIESQYDWLIKNAKMLFDYFKNIPNCHDGHRRCNVSSRGIGFSIWDIDEEFLQNIERCGESICPTCLLEEIIDSQHNPGIVLCGLNIKYKDLNKINDINQN